MNEQKHGELLEKFLIYLHAKEYFDAHEVLETLWFPRRFENNNEIKLLKGFINAAVSFELKKRGREQASKKVWENYIRYKQFLHKIYSPHINQYNLMIKEIENIKHKTKLNS